MRGGRGGDDNVERSLWRTTTPVPVPVLVQVAVLGFFKLSGPAPVPVPTPVPVPAPPPTHTHAPPHNNRLLIFIRGLLGWFCLASYRWAARDSLVMLVVIIAVYSLKS